MKPKVSSLLNLRNKMITELLCVAVCCSVLPCVAVCCSDKIITELTIRNTRQICDHVWPMNASLQHTATHCNALQHTATHTLRACVWSCVYAHHICMCIIVCMYMHTITHTQNPVYNTIIIYALSLSLSLSHTHTNIHTHTNTKNSVYNTLNIYRRFWGDPSRRRPTHETRRGK